jgi:predicted TIM-barrel fold metal-dependent hydrolase
VLFVEYGFTWALGLFWRFDNMWRATRSEVPWVRKAPSEYLHENIRFATQPLDDPSDPTAVARYIELFGPEHLCFSTDYPHWDNDMPAVSLMSLPESAQEAILSSNARSFLPLDR